MSCEVGFQSAAEWAVPHHQEWNMELFEALSCAGRGARAGAERFLGRQMHSHNYREAGPFAGQRVVVVGAAASGEDIGREISLQADQVRRWESPPRLPRNAGVSSVTCPEQELVKNLKFCERPQVL